MDVAMEQELDPSLPCRQRLLSAIIAMEPSECVISHARFLFLHSFFIFLFRLRLRKVVTELGT